MTRGVPVNRREELFESDGIELGITPALGRVDPTGQAGSKNRPCFSLEARGPQALW